MPELEPMWRPCVTGDCPTHVQGGTAGMLAHVQLLHHPDLTFDQLEEKYGRPGTFRATTADQEADA